MVPLYKNLIINKQSPYKKTIKALKKGNIVSLPTETVYGLAGNAYSQRSIKKIFNLVSLICFIIALIFFFHISPYNIQSVQK